MSLPPLVPERFPEGYELAEVAVSGRTVSLGYRRGLDRFVVTTRPGDASRDPFAVEAGPGIPEEPERVRLGGGVEARLVVGPC